MKKGLIETIKLSLFYAMSLSLFRVVIAFTIIGCIRGEAKDILDISTPANMLTCSFTFGNYYLLPSLRTNPELNYSDQKYYPDLWISGKIDINENLTYSGMLELTDLPENIVGTKYSRSDFVLSTGRFQESIIRYQTKSINIQVGRGNFFDGYRPPVFPLPVNGDGISWVFIKDSFSFKHVIETLPSQRSPDIEFGTVFRRLLNYHHLQFKFGYTSIGMGEYFILTGPSIGLDFKRLNPFIPYSRNSHDAFDDYFESIGQDSDNAIIVFFFKRDRTRSNINIKLYIDEFQMDHKDRVNANDALLFSIAGHRKFNYRIPSAIEGAISIANPNFGWHPGPFTSASSASYPLFESSTGMLSLIYAKLNIKPRNSNHLSVSYHHERWVNINKLKPGLVNHKLLLRGLKVNYDSRILFGYRQEVDAFHTSILVNWWRTFGDDENMGGSISFIYGYRFD